MLKKKGNLPIDDLFILSSDEVLLVRGDDAQRVLLACLGLSINDVCTEVHVHSTLRQRAWLQEKHDKHFIIIYISSASQYYSTLG